jgi:hypothetical protein
MLPLIYRLPPAHASAVPTIVGQNIATCGSGLLSCGVNVPIGGTNYFYAAAEGGSFNISPIDFSQDLAVTNLGGLQSVVIGHSASNTGTFNPNLALFPIIGGIGVTGTLVQTISFHDNGVSSISGTFSLAQDSLVVLVSSASNNNVPVSLSSPFVIDQQQSNLDCNFGTGCGGVVLAHASILAGSRAFTLAYTPVSAAFQDPLSEAIGVVLYVFPIFPSIPEFGQSISIVMVAAILTVMILILRSHETSMVSKMR